MNITKYINNAFRKCQKSDYWIDSGITEEDCQIIIERAEAFLDEIKKYLKR